MAAKKILVVKDGVEAAMPEWRAVFGESAPDLEVRWWDDPALSGQAVDYALVWQPEAGRLARLAGLRLVCSIGAGVDHITCDPDWPRHLPLVRMGGEETAARMGEYICLGVLAISRDLPRVLRARERRVWDVFDAERVASAITVGVMGLGNLGLHSARMLRGLGFRVIGWSRSPKRIDGIETYAGDGEFDAFLARSRILCCLLPDTPRVRGILNARSLALLPRGAGVVNAGRGVHVVLPDLLAALDAGHLAAAVLDVFDPEPLPPAHPVWTHPRILVTSHIASDASRRSRAQYVAEVIAAFEQGRKLPNLFDPVLGY